MGNFNVASIGHSVEGLNVHQTTANIPKFMQGTGVSHDEINSAIMAKNKDITSPEQITDQHRVSHLKEMEGSQFKDAVGIAHSDDGSKLIPIFGFKQAWKGEKNFEGKPVTKLQSGWVATQRGVGFMANQALAHPMYALGLATATAAGTGLYAEHEKNVAHNQGVQQGAQAALQQRSF